MKLWQPTAIALALAAGFPSIALAQSNEELMKEIRALRDRVNELEAKQKAIEAKGDSGQWGMTPAQTSELNRVTVKTEALEDSREANGFMGLKVSGQMQMAYIYNKAQDRAGFQFLDAVWQDGYSYDNSYIGMAMIDFQKEMEGGTKWRLTLAPQRGAGSTMDGWSIVHEASVSVPLTDLQTRFIAGQIPDWSGYEYLQPSLNKLITHNLLFDFTLPTAYVGAGFDITSGKWTTKVMLANMNETVRPAGNKAPVGAFRVDYSKGEYQGFGMAGVYGDAPNYVNETANTRVGLFEVDGYFIRGDWTLQGQLSYGGQKQAAITANPDTGEYQNSSWYGLSTLAAYKFTPRFEGVARFDYINNSKNGGGLLGYGADGINGIGPGSVYDSTANEGAGGWVTGDATKGANRYALSVGMSYVFNQYATFKAEYRYDWSNLQVFEYVSDGSFRKNNSVLGAAVVVGF
jgi:hypothetical protein